jgi:hypothetical protein
VAAAGVEAVVASIEMAAPGIEEAAAPGVKEEATVRVEREHWGEGEMRSGRVDPCWISAELHGARGFLGRGQPCPSVKLDFSFSTGQD